MALFVVPETPDVTGEPVLARLGDRLEAAEVPDVCHVLTALPLTPTGKTNRKELRRQLMEDTDVR
ncbi:hypothetical protein [Streptomyces acidicola]